MNTQTHLLVAAAAFARPGRPRVTLAALAGGLVPDLSLYVMVAWERLANGRTPRQIFDEDFSSSFWRTVFAVDNSAPLYALLLAAGLTLGPAWLVAFAGAALLHIALDLPVHHDDGRAHFQPFTDWVFESPISYWDRAHHGHVVGVIEGALVIGLALLLWLRFRGIAARALILLAVAIQFSTGAMWSWVFA